MNKNLVLLVLCAIFVVLGIIAIKIGIDGNVEYSKLKKVCTEKMQGIVTEFLCKRQSIPGSR